MINVGLAQVRPNHSSYTLQPLQHSGGISGWNVKFSFDPKGIGHTTLKTCKTGLQFKHIDIEHNLLLGIR